MFTKKDLTIRFNYTQRFWVMLLGGFEQNTFGGLSKKPNRDSQEQFVAFVNRQTELMSDK
jgi:hypothetical protein